MAKNLFAQTPDVTPAPDLGLQVYVATLKSELERIGWATTAYDRADATRAHSLATQLLDHVRQLNERVPQP
jgi:hypothetical protein